MSDAEETKVEETTAEVAVEVPAKFKKLVEEVESMSVLELHELVKVLEKKFGVSAAAVAVAAPAAGGAEEEAKSSFTVELTDGGAQKIAVIKVVKGSSWDSVSRRQKTSSTARRQFSRRMLRKKRQRLSRQKSRKQAERLHSSNQRSFCKNTPLGVFLFCLLASYLRCVLSDQGSWRKGYTQVTNARFAKPSSANWRRRVFVCTERLPAV